MKVYALEYKMKNARHLRETNEISRIKGTKKFVNISQNDEFLESAEDYYLNNNFRKDPQTFRHHNTQITPKVVKREVATQGNNTSRNNDQRIAPENLKRSVERDYQKNLQHWRKETFKYQQQVFALQRKNNELIAENKSLKYELKLIRETDNKDVKHNVINPQKQTFAEKLALQRKIRQLEASMQSKLKQILDMETIISTLADKLKNQNISILTQCEQGGDQNRSTSFRVQNRDFRASSLKSIKEVKRKYEHLCDLAGLDTSISQIIPNPF